MFLINIILGFVQGITEFLPISSSGHLLVFQHFFKLNNSLIIDIVLHIATIVAVIVFFAKDIADLSVKFFRKDLSAQKSIIFIFVVTLITGLIATIFKDFFEKSFNRPGLLSISFLLTGIILLATKKFTQGRKNIASSSYRDALILGLVQAVAIVPAISRSGITISALLFLGFKKEEAFRISFLASIPAVFGALVLEYSRISFELMNNLFPITVGFLAALFSGLFALKFLSLMIHKARFYLFGFYCLFAAVVTFILFK